MVLNKQYVKSDTVIRSLIIYQSFVKFYDFQGFKKIAY